MAGKSILTVGSLNMDQVVRVARMPALGETLLGAGSLKLVPGGKGANQAVALARLGAPVAMAYVTRRAAEPGAGTEFGIDVRGRVEPADLVELPFYRRSQQA
jgi:hypothetical protein